MKRGIDQKFFLRQSDSVHLYSNIDAVANLASTGVLGEVKHISQRRTLLYSAKFVIRAFSDLDKILFFFMDPLKMSQRFFFFSFFFFASLTTKDTIKMTRTTQYTSVKEGGYFRACHNSLTDQNCYDGDSSMVNALPLKDTGTDFQDNITWKIIFRYKAVQMFL